MVAAAIASSAMSWIVHRNSRASQAPAVRTRSSRDCRSEHVYVKILGPRASLETRNPAPRENEFFPGVHGFLLHHGSSWKPADPANRAAPTRGRAATAQFARATRRRLAGIPRAHGPGTLDGDESPRRMVSGKERR